MRDLHDAFEHIQWDEEFHVEDAGPRSASDGPTFSDAGLSASPEYIVGFGSDETAGIVRGPSVQFRAHARATVPGRSGGASWRETPVDRKDEVALGSPQARHH